MLRILAPFQVVLVHAEMGWIVIVNLGVDLLDVVAKLVPM